MASRHVLTRSIPTVIARAPAAARLPLRSAKMSATAPTARLAARGMHSASQMLKPVSASAALVQDYPTTHEKIETPKDTLCFLNNEFVPSKAQQWFELHDP